MEPGLDVVQLNDNEHREYRGLERGGGDCWPMPSRRPFPWNSPFSRWRRYIHILVPILLAATITSVHYNLHNKELETERINLMLARNINDTVTKTEELISKMNSLNEALARKEWRTEDIKALNSFYTSLCYLYGLHMGDLESFEREISFLREKPTIQCTNVEYLFRKNSASTEK